MESARIEMIILRARLQYLRSRNVLWNAMQDLSSQRRAYIFRKLDLVKACDEAKTKQVKNFIKGVVRSGKGDLDPSWHWGRATPVFHDID